LDFIGGKKGVHDLDPQESIGREKKRLTKGREWGWHAYLHLKELLGKDQDNRIERRIQIKRENSVKGSRGGSG